MQTYDNAYIFAVENGTLSLGNMLTMMMAQNKKKCS